MVKILENFKQWILKKNRVLQIGLVLFGLIIGVVLIGLILILLGLLLALFCEFLPCGSYPGCTCWGGGEGSIQWWIIGIYIGFAPLIISPLLVLALFFTFLSLLLKTKRKLFKIILIFLIFLLVLGSFLNGLSLLTYKGSSYLAKSLKFFPKSEKICEMIVLSYEKDECYTEFAKEKRNFRICDNNNWDDHLDYICYSKVAEVTKDETICQRLPYPDQRDFCYLLVARAKQDINLCQKIEEDNDRKNCLKSLTK